MRLFSEKYVTEYITKNLRDFMGYFGHRLNVMHSVNSSSLMGQPKKVVWQDPAHARGDVRAMFCCTDRVKIMKVISTNPHRNRHKSVSVGATLVLDPEENFPTEAWDSTALSCYRTAALMYTVAKAWMRGLSRVWVIGTGQVGTCLLEMLHEDHLVNEIRCYDVAYGFEPTQTFAADVIFVATNSLEPVLNESNASAPLIVSAGADTAYNRELDGGLFQARKNYIDCPEALYIGDLAAMDGAVTYTLENYLKSARATFRTPANFISVGSALSDAIAIEFLRGWRV